MKIAEIKKMPCVLHVPGPYRGSIIGKYHESLTRSYHLLAKVKELLEAGTPGSVVLEIIEDVEGVPQLTQVME